MVKKYFDYFWGLAFTKTAKSAYITTLGAGLNAFLGFVFTVVVARAISPSDFGLFSVVMNFIVILFVVCDVGLSSSVLRFLPQAIRDNRTEEVRKILKLSFLATVSISGVLAAILLLFASPIARIVFATEQLTLPIMVVSFSLIGLILTFLFTSTLQAQQRFAFAVVTEASVVFLKVLICLILMFLGRLDLMSVLIVYSATTFVGAVLGLFFIGPKFFQAQTDFRLAKVLFLFGVWVALARIANSISSKLDTLMLIRYVDATQVGFYAAAQRMTFIFPVFVNGVMVAISPKFSSLKTKDEVIPFIKKSSLLSSVLFVPIVLLFFLSPWIIDLVYGPEYQSSVTIFRWLLISAAFFVASSVPVTVILYFLGQSKFFAAISFLQLLLIVWGNLILIPLFGVIGPAISLALAYGIIFAVSSFMIYRKLKEQ